MVRTFPVEEKPEAACDIWAVVFLTSIDSRSYYNFSYKIISEDMGPCEDKCPESILKRLSPTDSPWANEWRERCWENVKKKKSPDALHNLPIGTVIQYMRSDDTVVKLWKHQPAYQFKRPFWFHEESGRYLSSKWIPENYEVVSRPCNKKEGLKNNG